MGMCIKIINCNEDVITLTIFLFQIFEWWYFRKYGTSFIEQVSVSHLRPLLGGVDNNSSNNSNSSNGDSDSNRQSVSGMKSPSICSSICLPLLNYYMTATMLLCKYQTSEKNSVYFPKLLTIFTRELVYKSRERNIYFV